MMNRKNKRPILLLEVLIAFTLVVLIAIPLMYPHAYILRMQREFIKEIELDHYVNIHYAQLTEQLYKNEVPWDIIEGKNQIPLKPKLPFTGTLSFKELKSKPKEISDYSVHLYEVTYAFTSEKGKPLNYVYHVMIVRNLPSTELPEGENEEKA